eukprot:IDg13994t1
MRARGSAEQRFKADGRRLTGGICALCRGRRTAHSTQLSYTVPPLAAAHSAILDTQLHVFLPRPRQAWHAGAEIAELQYSAIRWGCAAWGGLPAVPHDYTHPVISFADRRAMAAVHACSLQFASSPSPDLHRIRKTQ